MRIVIIRNKFDSSPQYCNCFIDVGYLATQLKPTDERSSEIMKVDEISRHLDDLLEGCNYVVKFCEPAGVLKAMTEADCKFAESFSFIRMVVRGEIDSLLLNGDYFVKDSKVAGG